MQTMTEGLRKTVSHTAIYGAGNIAQRLVGFLMLPIYTRYLSPADYGVVSMLQIILDLTSLIFGMQLATGVFRNYYQQSNDVDRRAVLSTALGVVLLTKGVGALVLCILAEPVSLLLFDEPAFSQYVRIYAFAVLTESLTFIPFQYIRLRERPVLFVGLSLLKLLVQLSLNIIFIIVLDMGVQGVVYSSVLSGTIVGGALSLWLIREVGGVVTRRHTAELVSYSWPLVFSGFVAVYLSAGSRVALTHFQGLAEVGLLALATQFAMIIRSLVWNPFNQVWGPQRFKLAKESNALAVFQDGFNLVSGVLLICGVAISVLADDVILIIADDAFRDAARIIPIVVFAEIIRCMTLFSNTPLLVAGNTREVFYSSLFSALIFTIVLALIVPRHGMLGAAVSSCVSALAQMWWIVRKANLERNLHLPWRSFWAATAAAAIPVAGSALIPETDHVQLASVSGRILMIFLFVLSVYYSPLVSNQHRRVISSQLSRIWRLAG